jgi:uncharacterized protein (DUF1697 family)
VRIAVFLRAVNVGRRTLKSQDIKDALADAGFAGAQTVGAAGTAVIEAPESGAELESRLEAAIAQRAGFTSEVFARTGAELEDVLAGNPFSAFAESDPAKLHVVFLRDGPEPAAVTRLKEKIPGREQAAGGPRCVYVTFPDGAGRSKVTPAMIEKAVGRGTARNWNTVRRMAELTAPA